MIDLLLRVTLVFYLSAAVGLMLYGLNCYVMIYLFRRSRSRTATEQADLLARFGDPMARDDMPPVTTQIAIYNELNVAERIIRAACAMQYPAGRHEIQLVDDSTDETRALVDSLADELRGEGHDVRVVRRADRAGYKAGALGHALDTAKGEFVAVFDADFVPPPDYLLRTVPFLMEDAGLGLVQARWGHLNPGRSLLTRAQSVGIDGHFVAEQAARTWNGLFMNFNGTAGIWRRRAIDEGGGWNADTLTEDLDLSYRVQLAGWRTAYVADLVVPAELPEDVGAFKSQQFRWAKGSMQTALKILPGLFRTSEVPLFKRLQAFLHLTHYLVHPMMLVLAVFSFPILFAMPQRLGLAACIILGTGQTLAMVAPSCLYIVSQHAAYRDDWLRRVVYLPLLIIVGVGIAFSNARAIAEALAGRQSPFVRTPKRGDREVKRYRVQVPWVAVAEVTLGLYCAFTLHYDLAAAPYTIGPFMAIYAAGFLFIGLLTLAHAFGFVDMRK